EAFLKAQLGAGTRLPKSGAIFVSVNDRDKRQVIELARQLTDLGFRLVATRGTQKRIEDAGLKCDSIYKVNEGRPNIVDLIKSKQIDLVINTPLGRVSFYDERAIRRAAMQYSVPCITTLTGAVATVAALKALGTGEMEVRSLQYHHARAANHNE
ncbi:MAG TPA: carbamoyl phosphate synthase large subunit, partial [Blastocatellia bacterium]|nr:carbamoyl phosphate synthase large subunit [Blastocatellia bacterium]